MNITNATRELILKTLREKKITKSELAECVGLKAS